jgi:hypothetical protein
MNKNVYWNWDTLYFDPRLEARIRKCLLVASIQFGEKVNKGPL